MTEDGRTVYEEASQAFAPLFAMEKRIDDLNRQLTERTDYDSPEYYKLIEEVSALSEKYYSIDLYHACRCNLFPTAKDFYSALDTLAEYGYIAYENVTAANNKKAQMVHVNPHI